MLRRIQGSCLFAIQKSATARDGAPVGPHGRFVPMVQMGQLTAKPLLALSANRSAIFILTESFDSVLAAWPAAGSDLMLWQVVWHDSSVFPGGYAVVPVCSGRL